METSTPASELYEVTGSLLLATGDDITKIKDNYIETIKGTKTTYSELLQKEYSGKESNTVANRVWHVSNSSSGSVLINSEKYKDESEDKIIKNQKNIYS